MDHGEARKSFGSDSAQLVYGKRTDGTLAHISDVVRGLACQCICPACEGQLVARTKADFRVPHFAHNGGEACGGGPETALHLLAKEVFRSNPMLLLPERLALDKQQREFMLPAQEVATEFLRMEYTDRERIIPDLYVRALGHELFVEVAVTHFCEAVKVEHLRKHGIPAIEIDLSKLPRDSTREIIAEAVLRSAKRQWLYHPNIDNAEARREESERRRQDEIAEERARTIARGETLAVTYQDAVQTLRSSTAEYPHKADLEARGLAEHVGIKVPGFACFTVVPAVWQSIILIDVIHKRALGNQPPTAISITNYLEKRGLVRPEFRRISRDVADYANEFDWTFAPPWKAVDSYIKRLMKSGIVSPHNPRMVLSSHVEGRFNLVQNVARKVTWILDSLPSEERGNLTADLWLDSRHPKSGKTYRAMLQPESDIVSGINSIVEMFERNGPIVRQTFGLPIEAAILRRRDQTGKQVALHRIKQVEDAARIRQTRRDRLCGDVDEGLAGPEIGAFLNTKRAELGGMSPLESAEDSESGLSRARELLSKFVWQRENEAEEAAERERYREKITADAKRALSAADADAFLKSREDDFGRASCLSFVRDEHTYRKALVMLSQWEREFGRS
ncbi:MAG: hypothetical protein EOQ86_31565 [Mesorhizobium sp.]|uniref:competence protein CoiA family protein n=1 Tax=Mesorhizobium sp. TaxID=1871066 RepID=UPI000FE774B0|nr:competence protein CoiA family protein [Mesorhizobium sp.]RWH69235.1 MAG: hypothetical protein EOQ85_33350 [Mesorhizobium sp.]RWH75370.1 MAG: hypothetical protein EOQ86_31565 [Mesorhizobium sp.]RWH83368.1 MAG: hypothetical protein EOQ87_33195 [Mesorhizobium sp.]RWH90776.1 MAG: hypothetical protein EOQ88_32720 [Mesorhizobium sp.]RWH95132.1 MAG: hypothetical protein EOQ89_31930 [Mesorhizobium sp.]